MTRDEAEEMYQSARQAYLDALQAQSYKIGTRSLTRQSISALKAEMNRWQAVLDRMDGGGVRRAVPIDL